MTPVTDPNVSLSALQLLQGLQQGQLLNDLNSALRDVARDVVQCQKPGEIILKIKIDIVERSQNAIMFKAEVQDKPPKMPVPTDMFFMNTRDWTFHHNNPKQQDMFGPRAVDNPLVDKLTGEIIGGLRSMPGATTGQQNA